MLGYMRRHKRWLFIFLWLVIAAFIILYIPAFESAGSAAEVVGSVGGVPITAAELRTEYFRLRGQYERLYQGRLTAEALSSLGLEDQAFASLVADRLVELEAERLGIDVSEAELAARVLELPDFQRDGRFIGAAEVRLELERSGLTVEQFERLLRRQMLRDKLVGLVGSAVSVSEAELEQEFRRRRERVRLEYVLVESAPFEADVTVEEADARQHFEAERESYRVPEKRVVDYVLVDAAALQAQVNVSDPEIESYYESSRDEFRRPEQVCARHVLWRVQPEAGGEGHPQAEAESLALKALEELAAGADFASLAEKRSEDPGSASRGGDLGCFPRGRMQPAFEEAAFALEPGRLSEPVRTSFGVHLIRVESRQEETVAPLSEVRERIRQVLLGQKVEALVEEKAAAVSGALQAGRSLEQAAQPQGLSVQKSPELPRGEPQPPLASPLLVARAFELAPGETAKEPFGLPRGYAFIRLAEVKESRLPGFEEARSRVEADLKQQRARERARALAGELRSAAETKGLESAAATRQLLRKETPSPVARGQALGELGTGLALEQAAFGLAEGALSEPVRVAAGYAVFRVLERTSADPGELAAERAELAASLREQKRGQLFQAYMDKARERFPVERRADAVRSLFG